MEAEEARAAQERGRREVWQKAAQQKPQAKLCDQEEMQCVAMREQLLLALRAEEASLDEEMDLSVRRLRALALLLLHRLGGQAAFPR